MSLGLRTTHEDKDIWNIIDGGSLGAHATIDGIPEEVEFLVKNQYLTYVGNNLQLVSGLDLSSNKFTGGIPSELGDLSHVISLNLSCNRLSGPIPNSFSNLKQIQSLDLSSNNLSGTIPSHLAKLNFLTTFNVSYNHLMGRTPETGQFATFDQSSYYGNPGMCVSLLNTSCGSALKPSPTTTTDSVEDRAAFIGDFLWSLSMSSVTVFLATTTVLYINPQWRRAWFDFVDWHVLWWLP